MRIPDEKTGEVRRCECGGDAPVYLSAKRSGGACYYSECPKCNKHVSLGAAMANPKPERANESDDRVPW
jgi:hypothetical protein